MVKEDFPKLMEIWARIINKMNEADSKKRDYGTGDLLSPSEIHLLQAIGGNQGIQVTGMAEHMGVTKGAVSQMVKKLAAKDLVLKYSGQGNEKEVLLKLTASGIKAKKGHDRHHAMFIEEVKSTLGDLTEDQILFLEKFLLTVEKCIDDFNESGD
jgi:DNA-binding MarR family transcriptional regulator